MGIILALIGLTFRIQKVQNLEHPITLICCGIFALQEIQLSFQYGVKQKNNALHMQSEFREKQLVKLFCFVTLYGTFLPLHYYLPIVGFSYGIGFWIAFSNQ